MYLPANFCICTIYSQGLFSLRHVATSSQIMDVQIRLARRTDLAAIIEMSKGIYDGHDYFPHVFLQWHDEPNRRIIVAEKAGFVVGIRAFHIVDGGKTVVSQSLRVHPKFRGQGVSAILILAEQQYVKKHFPCVTTERYTTMSTNCASFGHSAQISWRKSCLRVRNHRVLC